MTPSVTNIADGDAKVDAQIGVVSGDAVFHRHETIYQVSGDDSPERRYRVARNHLEGGTPRAAEELLGQVLRDGLVTTEVAYYYAIAVLSDRPLSHLGPTEFENFDFALRSARRFQPDEWRVALDVIGDLMSCVSRQEVADDVDLDTLTEVLAGFERLADDRRTEISRHLDMILAGAVQDQVDRLNAGLVAAGRTAGERQRRAWKFFQPDPAEPRRVEAGFHGDVEPRLWVMAVLGILGFFGALALASGGLGTPGGGPPLLWVVPVLGGAGVAWWYGSIALAAVKRRRRLDVENGAGASGLSRLDGLYRYGRPYFRAGLSLLAQARFADLELSRGVSKNDLEQWYEDMSTAKQNLLVRLIRTYGVWQPESETGGRRYSGDLARFMAAATDGVPRERDIPPATLNWLIRWHARRAARQWREGTHLDHRKLDRADLTAIAVAVGGALAAFFAAIGLVTTDTMSGLAVFVCVVGVVLAGVGVFGAVEIRSERLAVVAEEADRDALHQEELAAYEEWVRTLDDRPTDAEMARWLDFDKNHLKTEAMRHCGLTNRDIIAHVVLTEGASKAKRARVLHGPPRYSSYVVLVFLLTEGGVRVVEVTLDFEDGAVHDEKRTVFRYDSLTSARMAEVGVRFAGERRQVVVINDDRVRVTEETESLVLSRAFRLSLGNGDNITILVENFDGILDDDVEDKSRLDRLALDTSGVAGALRTLEAIAAEGREWIVRERERRDRRWRDWARGPAGRAAIEGGVPELPAIEEDEDDEPTGGED